MAAASRKKNVWNPGLEELDHFQLQGCQQQQAAAFSSNEFDKEAEEQDQGQIQRQEENGNHETRPQDLPPSHQMPSSAAVPFMPMPPSFGHPNHPFALLAAHFHHQQQQQQQQQLFATNKLMTHPPPTPFLLPKMLLPPNFAALPTSMGPSPHFFPFGPAAMVLAAAAAQRNQLLAANNVNSSNINVGHPMAGWRMPFHHFCPADRRLIGSINVGGQNAVAAHPPPQAMLAQTAAEFAGDHETIKKPAKKSIKTRKRQPSREEEMEEELERKRKKRNNGNGGQWEEKEIAGAAAAEDEMVRKTAAAAGRVGGGGNPIVELLLLGEQNEKKPSPPIVVNFNTCAVCGAQFRLTAELVQHARTNHRHSSRYDREQQPTSIAEAQLREERLKKMEQQKERAAQELALAEESG